ncbi:MAG: hypothetical protein PHP69_06370 [Candidatus Omnitrophica bacterium]|nr:hypothetical protein [Candidatus Omnitrophota bacterium]MDD5441608.1 hypothetical protein [Candidatus Omnitrophota bacterium]
MADSAEKELLKTIEGGSALKEVNLSKNSASILSLRGRGEFLISNFQKIFTSDKQALFSLVNNILLGVILVIGIFMVVEFIRGYARLNSVPKFTLGEGNDEIVEQLKFFDIKNKEDYYNVLVARNIFNPAEEKKKFVEQEKDISEVAQLLNNFKMVGFYWTPDEQEKYAMIEDSASQLTYYLKEGDDFMSFKVEKVDTDKVIMSFDDEEITLR